MAGTHTHYRSSSTAIADAKAIDTVTFIAPNGARVSVSNWNSKVTSNDPQFRWSDVLLLQVIFNDPILAEPIR